LRDSRLESAQRSRPPWNGIEKEFCAVSPDRMTWHDQQSTRPLLCTAAFTHARLRVPSAASARVHRQQHARQRRMSCPLRSRHAPHVVSEYPAPPARGQSGLRSHCGIESARTIPSLHHQKMELRGHGYGRAKYAYQFHSHVLPSSTEKAALQTGASGLRLSQ